jgi:hypothetical protein
MTNDEAMFFAGVIVAGFLFITIYLITKDD